jgi:hypothetical protein
MRSLYYNMRAFSKEFEVHFIRVGNDGGGKALIGIPKYVKFSQVCPKACLDPSAALMPLHAKSILAARGAQHAIQQYIDRENIDAVLMHAMDVSFALRGLRAPVKVANQIDSFAMYYTSKRKATPGVQARALEAVQLFLYWFVERELARNFSLVAYVSSEDVDRKNLENSFVISQSRDPPMEESRGRRPVDVVIIGRWEHPPNRDGIAAVMGSLGGIRGNVEIIGPNLKQLGGMPQNVKYRGMVQSIDDCLNRAKVCLIPVWYGAGLQTKVFDALRHGCVVVTTSFTKKAFDANCFSSGEIIASGDLVAAANAALAGHSPGQSRSAYASYKRFYLMNAAAEKEYVRRVAALVERARQPRP